MSNQAFRRVPDELIPFRNIVVNRAGDVSTFSPELASSAPGEAVRFSVGNVHELRSFAAMRNNARFREMRREIQAGLRKCARECQYFPICGGGSPSNKICENGTFNCAETVTCSMHRKALADVVAEKLRVLSEHRQDPVRSAMARGDYQAGNQPAAHLQSTGADS